MCVNSLPKTVTRQRRDCYLNPGPSASESSTLTTRLRSHPLIGEREVLCDEHVCLSVCVCLSVHDHMSGTTCAIFDIFCVLFMAVVRLSCVYVVISYLFFMADITLAHKLIGCWSSPSG